MEIAKIRVNSTTGRCLTRKQIPARLVGGTVSVEFADSIWDRLNKTVVFRCEQSQPAEFDGKTAVIPWELLQQPGKRLYFGIWGNDPGSDLQIPLIEVPIGVVEASTDPEATPGADPTLPIWAQLQEELDSLRNQVENDSGGGLSFSVVSELPTENISTGTIYLVKDAEADGNIYTEYLYINGAWEIVGSQQLDLTGYAKTEDIPTDEHIIDLIEENAPDGIAVTGATVGQIVKISAVDENGVPTAWEGVDFPSGGGSGEWELIVDVELTESTTDIVVSQDINGNPFDLDVASVAVYMPANPNNANANTTAWLLYDKYHNGKLRSIQTIYNAQGINRYIVSNVVAYGNKAISTHIGANFTFDPDVAKWFSYFALQCKTDGNSFMAGTRIMIRGHRVNEG